MRLSRDGEKQEKKEGEEQEQGEPKQEDLLFSANFPLCKGCYYGVGYTLTSQLGSAALGDSKLLMACSPWLDCYLSR